ncbi:uroporphyrinogen-III synthase [Bacillus sp. SCS-153A]|uniref:uroporphyrinogen-III synthase n=1 Tax=Rossellomorea sedimentorum TaxID=3115294 RepID=UPI003906A7AE
MDFSLPLWGREILVTREEKAAKGLADLIRQYGGIPHIVPLIAFRPYIDDKESTYLERLKSYEWIFFTSKNGVHFFFEKLKKHNLSLEVGNMKFAAVGEKTCKALHNRGIQVDFVPRLYSGLEMAKEFVQRFPGAGRVLLSKGNLARDTISSYFAERSMPIDEWITYETFFPSDSEEKLIALLQQQRISAVTFTSPSTIRGFMKVVNDHGLHDAVKSLSVVCVGPVTKEAAYRNGLTVQVVPERYTVEEMIKDLAKHFISKEESREE